MVSVNCNYHSAGARLASDYGRSSLEIGGGMKRRKASTLYYVNYRKVLHKLNGLWSVVRLFVLFGKLVYFLYEILR